MPTILVMTVGGSCAPILTALRAYQPSHVCFCASSGPRGSRASVDGPGDPCGDRRKATCPTCGNAFLLGSPKGANIVTQAGLREPAYSISELEEPDAFRECYMTIWERLAKLEAEYPGSRYIADYTGGTKTMTAALCAAALDRGWELSLVQGARADLVKVRDGTEMAGLVNSVDVRARQALALARLLFNGYAYASAAELLQVQLRTAPLSPDLQRELTVWVTLCRAFDAWDHFDHVRARSLLETCKERCLDQWKFLFRLTGPQPGYMPVMDLVRNAERRASRGRYDDAVARCYRALELLAQLRLKARGCLLDGGDLDVSRLPEPLRPSYEALRDSGGRVKLGLRQDYELLVALGDSLGAAFAEQTGPLLDMLSHRNASILAHGSTPVSSDVWHRIHETSTTFIALGLEAVKGTCDAPQFPRL